MGSMAMDLGFLGLGNMGGAIAERLIEGGAQLHVFDPNQAVVAGFIDRGAKAYASPVAVASQAGVVFACLPAASISAKVAGELAAETGAMKIYVEMSTIGSKAVQAIAETLGARGVQVVDSPISGGPKGAQAGTLSVITAGPPAAIEAVRPWLEKIGKTVFILGEKPGQAQLMKLVNNLMNAANMATTFEALVLGAKGGLDADTMVEVINASSGRSAVTEAKVPLAVLTGKFDYGARLAIMHKDVVLGLAEAEQLGVPMWAHETIGQLWSFAMTQGRGEDDFTSLIKVMEGWAGAEVRGRGA
jgi:3-hydroxyisobutyrate dehydrogenase-like beta-hydroxyacid dehydrogenase